MAKRLFKAVMFIPLIVITIPLEMVYVSLRWIVTGRDFPYYPMVHKFVLW